MTFHPIHLTVPITKAKHVIQLNRDIQEEISM